MVLCITWLHIRLSIAQLHTFYWYHTQTKYASWYDEFPNDIITISPFPVFHEKIKMRRPLVASTTSINPT